MEDIQKKIAEEVKVNPVILYMKGTKIMPMCGFSKTVVDILTKSQIEFETRDVLEDATLRDGIKLFSNWPTIPQLYVKGKFIGGCDIVREMYQSGELKNLFAAPA